MSAAPPLEGLARAAFVYGVGLAAWLVLAAALRRPVSLYEQVAGVLLWVAAAVVAASTAVTATTGDEEQRVAVIVAYAVATAAVIPTLWWRARRDDDGEVVAGPISPVRPGVAATAVGATAVLLLRLRAVW